MRRSLRSSLPISFTPRLLAAARRASAALVLALVFGACDEREPERLPAALLTLNATVDDGVLELAGNADLPDSTWVLYRIRRLTGHDESVDGVTRVAGGSFRASAFVGELAGPLAVVATFDPSPPSLQQPPEVISRFGADGERLQGPGVVEVEGRRRLEVWQTVDD